MVGGTARFDELTRALSIDLALLIDERLELTLTPGMANRLLPPPGAAPQAPTGELPQL